MTTNHIDQLTEWWENAEQGTARRGDALIGKGHGGHFMIYTADCDEEEPDDAVRILARAPKPKSAWHDAAAVMAALDVNSYDEWSDGAWPARREIWVRDGEAWESIAEGITVPPERLIGPTPLIEAKVTDEMVERAITAFWGFEGDVYESMPAALHAALGLDPA